MRGACRGDRVGGCEEEEEEVEEEEEEEEDLEWVLVVDGELLVDDGRRKVDMDGCAEQDGDGDGVDARNGMEEVEMSAEAELGHEG